MSESPPVLVPPRIQFSEPITRGWHKEKPSDSETLVVLKTLGVDSKERGVVISYIDLDYETAEEAETLRNLHNPSN